MRRTAALLIGAGVLAGCNAATTAHVVHNLGSPVVLMVTGTGTGTVNVVTGEGGLHGANTNQKTVSLPYQLKVLDAPSEVSISATDAHLNGTSTRSLSCEIDAPGRTPVKNTSIGVIPSVTCIANALVAGG